MKMFSEVVTEDVTDVCKQIVEGLITITEAAFILVDLDCMLVAMDGNTFTLCCYSESIAVSEVPLDQFAPGELPVGPKHYKVQIV